MILQSAGPNTIRLAAALSAQHAEARDRSLTVLRGGLAAECGLLGLLQRLRENNDRRLAANGSAWNETSDRELLETWLQVVQRLHGREGRRRATRLLRKETDAEAELRRLGARFARHCGQGCSLTGVRVSDLSIEQRGAQRVGADTVSPSLDQQGQPFAGAWLAGAFRVPGSAMGPGRRISLTVHNVLGRTRPLVPLFVKAEAQLPAGRRLPLRGEIFVYAEEVVPGMRRDLTCSADGLLDLLPCPAGLIQSVLLQVWMPTGQVTVPGPISQRMARVA